MQSGTQRLYPTRGLPAPESIDLEQTALLLDFDGTLVDIATTPAGVDVPPTLRETLKRLFEHCGGALALVSGRSIETLDRLFEGLRLPAIGVHGAEMRMVAGGTTEHRGPQSFAEPVRRQILSLAESDPRLFLEDKSFSLALHYRRAPDLESRLKQRVAAILSQHSDDALEILLGKAVIEIKSNQFNKGTAVCELMTVAPFAGRTPLFIGDDITDESVFSILPRLDGIGLSVGRDLSSVQGTFASPEDVRSWLQLLSAQTGSER